MKNIEYVLIELAKKGLRLEPAGDRLTVHAPKGSITPEIAKTIRERKTDILTFLTSVSHPKSHIEKAPPCDTPPMSFAQQRLWFLDELATSANQDVHHYNMCSILEIKGHLDAIALENAIQRMTQRHENLRTNFQQREGKPVQIIHDSLAVAMRFYDMAGVEEGAIKTLGQTEMAYTFNLAEEPLFRISLLRLHENHYQLLLCMHHIISDAWSMQIFVHELVALYVEIVQGIPARLAPLTLQYSDFSYWQQQNEQLERMAQQATWWRENLAEIEPVHQLPLDRPRPQKVTFRGKTYHHKLTKTTAEDLTRISQDGLTHFMVLLAAFKVLLFRFSQQTDIVVGTPVANRNQLEIEPLIGFFVNTLVLRTAIDPTQSFTEFLQQVRHTATQAYAHQDLPFEQVVDELKPDRHLNHTPLFQIVFAHHENHDSMLEIPGLALSAQPIESGIAKFDLTLDTHLSQEEFATSWEYNCDLFDEATIIAFARYFDDLLSVLLRFPDRALADSTVIEDLETQAQFAKLNQVSCDYDLHAAAHIHFEKQAAHRPSHQALILSDEGDGLTYGELNQRANQWARLLIARGVQPETRIALLAPSSPELIIGLLAIFKAGAVVVPMDPKTPPARLQFMLEDSQVALVLSTSDDIQAPENCPVLRLDEDLAATQSGENLQLPVALNQIAFLIYTSGSTGIPKASMNTHLGLLNQQLWMQATAPMAPTDRMVNKATIGFDAAIWECMLPLIQGAQLVLSKPGTEADVTELCKILESKQVTHVFFVPSVLRALLDYIGQKQIPFHLRHIYSGGEAALAQDHQRVLATFGTSQAPVHFYNIYGPSECAITAMSFDCGQEPVAISPAIGQPHGNLQAYVADARMNLTPMGMPGELLLAGVGLSRGYFGKPGLTASKFVPNPFESTQPGSRLYRTGDLARLKPDGLIYFVSRIDHQVKLRGMRIELGEIEACLVEHPSITKAAVVVHHSEKRGQQLVGYFETESPAEDFETAGLLAEIKAQIGQKLPAYMVPGTLIPLEKLPQLASGKIARVALARRPLEHASHTHEYRPPQSLLEKALAELWCEVLDLETVGLEDNFFEVGGHSLLATRVVSRIRDQLSLEFPLEKMFSLQTLEQQARWLENHQQRSSLPAVTPIERDGQPLALSFAQQRLWFIDKLTRREGTPSGAYNISSILKIQGTLAVEALQEALTHLEMRHEVLRTEFKEIEGAPYQTIRQKPVLQLGHHDFSHRDDDEVRQWVNASTNRGFDLEKEPLLRLDLLQSAEDVSILVLTIHHIISDGWSMNILVRELVAFYSERTGLGSASLPPLDIQYADFGAWQHREEVLEAFDQQAVWWQKRLAGVPSLHQLPTDRPRPKQQTEHGAAHFHPMDSPTSAELENLGRSSGATVFMVALTAFKVLLAKYSGQEDIVVGTPIANRNRKEIEPLIGFFVNTLVLRTQIDQNLSFTQLLREVTQLTLESFDHQDIPFEKMVDLIQPVRDASHSPLFQIMFSLQGQQKADFRTPGLSLTPMPLETNSAKFDLHLDLLHHDQGLASAWLFNTDLFDLATIEAMAATFHELLKAILQNPNQKLSELAIHAEDEPFRWVPNLNQDPPNYQVTQASHVHFERQAASGSDHVALILTETDTTMTYGELNQRANQWAWFLLAQGIVPDDRVALIAQSSAELVIGLLAIFKAGAAVVPFDANIPKQRLHHMLEDSQVKLALSQGNGPSALPGTPVFRLETLPTEQPTENPNVAVDLAQAAYLTYTSGSTGTPKASINTHHGMINHHLWMQQIAPMAPKDRILNKTTVSFDAAMWECLLPLVVGAQLVLGKAGMEGDPFALRQALKDYDVTHTFFVPSVLRALLDLQGATALHCKIRHVFCGGEKVQPLDHQRVLRLIENTEAPVHFYNIYGPSECAITTVAHPCGPTPQSEFPPIGKPHGNVEAYVVDPHLTAVPVDMPGELVLAGCSLSRGYHQRPGLTAAKFVPNPFPSAKPGSRLYRTGDLVRYRSDQHLHFVSRIGNQVKLRGVRIELGEIEAALTAQPEILQAAVVVNQTDSGGQRLIGYIKWEGANDTALLADIKARLNESLPAYMVPSGLVPLEQLPQLPSGKIARLELASRPLSFDTQQGAIAYREPQTDLEKTLAQIWAQVLERDQVGLDDNFFEIGGHSLLATQVVSRMRDQLAFEFPLEKMFSLQTIAQQTAWLAEHQPRATLPLITPTPRDHQRLELSFAQQRLWFIDQLTHRQGIPSGAYNMSSILKMKGTVSLAALQHALTQLEIRHEVLRTQFQKRDGKPFQVIRQEPAFEICVHDFTEMRTEEWRQWVDASTQLGFDLERDPLLRMDLVMIGRDEYILVLTMHHIISDGWSMGILVRELIAYYSEAIGLGPAALPALEIQYADFSTWQQSDSVAAELDRQTAWWEAHLAGLPALHQLPTDRPRPPRQTHRGAALSGRLDTATTTALENLGKASGATLFMVLLTAFKVLLAKYSGQQDIVVGTPIANRNRSQVEPLIGFFVNTLVLRDAMDPHQSFRSLLDQVKTNTLQSYAHQDVPFEKLVDLLQPERQTSYSPLFQIMFSMQNLPATKVTLSDLEIESMQSETIPAKFDLTFDARETPAGIATQWRFNTDLFNEETIERLIASFQRLVEQIVSKPDQAIGELSLTSEREWETQVRVFNQTQIALDNEKPMYSFIEAWAADHPDRLALTSWNGETWTYHELNCQANKIAWQLRDLGVGLDDRVAVFMDRSPEMIIALVAILKAGAAYVPVDPEYPEQRWAHMLADSQASLLLTTKALRARLGERKHVCIDDLLGRNAPDANLHLPFSPDQGFFLIYTSGSSGKPKASINRHRGMVNSLLWHQKTFPLAAEDRVALKTPFGFDVASWETFWPLIAGASLVIAKPGTSGDPFYLRTWLVEQRISSIHFVPSMLRAFLDSLKEQAFHSHLRYLFSGGEALATETQHAVLTKMTGAAGPLEIHNLYGPSEASLRSTYFSCGTKPLRDFIPIGKPLGNTQAYVVDNRGRIQPLGVPGELQVAGVHTSRGYLGKPALTAERFIPNPFAQHLGENRMYRTGDLVRRLPQGDLLYLGRVDAQVKLRGMRLELGDIEAQINAVKGVDFARVFLNAPTGNQHLVAFIQTLAEDTDTFFKHVREALSEELPAYMVPASMIAIDTWPLLPNGKIDGRKLQALAAKSQATHGQNTYVPPRNPTEVTLCEIWQEVLSLERVGIHDSFFETGGHSLLATQVVSRMRDRLELEFPLEKMFSLQTIAQQAQWLETHQTAAVLPPITPVARHGQPLALSFAQQRLWFIDQLTQQEGTPSGAYNMTSVLKMRGTLDVQALQNALTRLEMRHEVLRTQFGEIDGAPLQIIRQEPAFRIRILDFMQTSEEDQQQCIEALTQQGFLLDTDPLLRLDLLLCDETEYILVLTMHHIISDGWSMGIFVRELIAFYSETIGLGPASLPELEVQYADFSSWQHSEAVVAELDRQTRWWESHLAGLPALHQLPIDRPRPRYQSQRGTTLAHQFDPTTTAGLERLGSASGATMFMVMLTAFKIFLAKYSGQEDIVVGTPIANRNRSQIEPLIGFFVNTLVLRDHMDANQSFQSLLDQVKTNTLQSYARQDVPFEKLVDLLQPERQTSYSPLFQIMFSMQNAPSSQLSLQDLQIEAMGTKTGVAKFELSLDVRETEQGLATLWNFNTDVFESATIQRMMAAFQHLIDQILEAPHQKMSQLSLTSQEEWDYQAHELNPGPVALDSDRTMHSFIENWAVSHPQRLALTSWNGETWTYDQLNRQANKIAWQLRDAGIRNGDRIAVFMQRSPEMIASLIAIHKAGAAYIPVDPEYPEQRWNHMLEDSRATLLLTTTPLSSRLGKRSHLCVDDLLKNNANEANLNLPFSPDQGFYLIYTSGSSGKPKASVNHHRGMLNQILWHQNTFPLGPEDRVALKTPFGFDVASWETFWPLLAGASLVIAKPGTSGDPFYLKTWLVEHQVTSVYFVPSMLRAFLDSLEDQHFHSNLRYLFCGGEALPTETQQAVLTKMTGPDGPVEIQNLYGPSEVSITVTSFPCGKGPRHEMIPIGKPTSNTHTYVVDAHSQIQPLGVPGELQVAGVQLSRGYFGKPGLTAARFVPNPFARDENDSRLYRTGDLVRLLPTGDLLYLGRIDSQVKLRGMRLELGEIEYLINSLDQVDLARVFLNAPTGNQHLVAFIQTQEEDKDAFFRDIQTALAEDLPSYMIPSTMIPMDTWPLLPNGKIDSRSLQAMAAKSQGTQAQRTYEPPRNEIEETLCDIWQRVLGLDRVGIHDSFFEIGGHSLLATQVLSRMRQAFPERLSLQYLFEKPTIAHLCEGIQNIRKSMNQDIYANHENREEFEF